jgi:Swt1-like HEPN
MGVSNRDRIGTALDSLRQGLYPYVEQKMQAVHGGTWMTKVALHLRDHQKAKQQVDNIICEDVSALLRAVCASLIALLLMSCLKPGINGHTTLLFQLTIPTEQ